MNAGDVLKALPLLQTGHEATAFLSYRGWHGKHGVIVPSLWKISSGKVS